MVQVLTRFFMAECKLWEGTTYIWRDLFKEKQEKHQEKLKNFGEVAIFVGYPEDDLKWIHICFSKRLKERDVL
jgi:hypothetical protein